MRKKSRPYRLASPSQNQQIPALSDDSLSERSEQLDRKRRPRSDYISYESIPRSTRFDSSPTRTSQSAFLTDLQDSHHSKKPYGLTKSSVYAWKNSPKKNDERDLTKYPTYSIEKIPPSINKRRRSAPISSRHIVLQRGKLDYWDNMKTSPDNLLTTSCQNYTGSASNLLLPTLGNSHRANPNGNIISITTTKRRQPSLLNQSQNTEWNIEGDGKQVRYQNLKWYSVEQLPNENRSTIKPRIKRRSVQQASDSATDTASSSEQHHQSSPPILERKSNLNSNKRKR